MDARLAIVIVNWRGWADTIQCLESIFRCDTPVRVVVCDNASGDGSVDRIVEWADGHAEARALNPELGYLEHGTPAKPIPYKRLKAAAGNEMAPLDQPLTIVENEANLGYAGGNNVGIRMALDTPGIDVVWLLNNDTVIDPGAPQAILRGFDDDKSVGILGTTLRLYDRPHEIQMLNGLRFEPWSGRATGLERGQPANGTFDAEDIRRRTDFVCGASMAVSRHFLNDVGLMEEGYFLYYEEVDWAVRGRGKFKIGFAPDAIVFHKEGASIGSNRNTAQRSELSEYYHARSKIMFGMRHYWKYVPIYLLLNLATAARRLTQGNPKNSLAIIRGTFGLPRG